MGRAVRPPRAHRASTSLAHSVSVPVPVHSIVRRFSSLRLYLRLSLLRARACPQAERKRSILYESTSCMNLCIITTTVTAVTVVAVVIARRFQSCSCSAAARECPLCDVAGRMSCSMLWDQHRLLRGRWRRCAVASCSGSYQIRCWRLLRACDLPFRCCH